MADRSAARWFGRRSVQAVLTYGATNAVVRVIGGLLTLAYAFRLSAEELGGYAIFTSIVTLADVLGDLGVSTAIIRQYFDHDDTPDAGRRFLGRVVITVRLLALGVFVVVGAFLFLAWDWFVAGQLHLWPYLFLALLLAFIYRSNTLFDAITRTLDHPRHFASYRLVQVLALVGFSIVLVFALDLGLLGAVLAAVCAAAVGAVFRGFTIARLVPHTVGGLSWKEIKGLLGYGLPLLPQELADWGRTMALRLVLANILPIAQIGVLFLATSIIGPIGLIITSFEMWFNPVYMKMRVAGGKDSFRKVRLIRQFLLAFLTPLYVAAIMFLPTIADLILPERYHEALPLLAPFLATSYVALLNSFQTRQLLYLRRTLTISAMSIATMALTLGVAPVMAVTYGLAGVAWTALGVASAGQVLTWYVVSRSEPNELRLRTSLAAMATATAATLYDAWAGNFVSGPADLAARGAAVLLACGVVGALWLWPNRSMIRGRFWRTA